jgi:hypothetical protein
MKYMRVPIALAVVAVVAIVSVAVPALGGAVQAQSVTRSYIADSALQAGMIVRLAGDDKVAPVSQDASDKIHGLVIRPNDAALSLSGQSEAGQQVYVATSGTYQALVSTQNGTIAKDDYIVVSAIEGIGMKADKTSGYVVGKVVSAGFDGSGGVLSQTTVKDGNGNERTVKIGSVAVDINVRRNPLYEQGEAMVPGFLQKAADSVANKQVSPMRAYIGLAIVLVTGIAMCVVLYAGVRTSIISLGRNPLARKSIMRNLVQVILVGLIILAAGLFAVYLLLKL